MSAGVSERWVVVPAKAERRVKPIGAAAGTGLPPITDVVQHPTIVFHVPEDFRRSWQKNRP
jgi:hypothetical protein